MVAYMFISTVDGLKIDLSLSREINLGSNRFIRYFKFGLHAEVKKVCFLLDLMGRGMGKIGKNQASERFHRLYHAQRNEKGSLVRKF